MKNKLKRKCFTAVISLFVLLLAIQNVSKGNNVRINGMVRVKSVVSDTATLEINLTWENSWRDNFNWDAVWLFLKVKPFGGEWSHVYLAKMQHTASNGYKVLNGETANSVVGVYVYPESNRVSPQASTVVTLKWACGNTYTKEMFDQNRVFLLAQGIEMVHVPYGSYYLGDEVSYHSFRSHSMRILPAEADIIGTDPDFEYSCIPSYWSGSATDYAPPEGAADRQNNSLWISPYTHAFHAGTVGQNISWIVNFKSLKTIRTFGVSVSSTYTSTAWSGYYRPAQDWYLLGSRDSVTWDTLQRCTPFEAISDVNSYPVRHAIRISRPGAYQYYRIYMPYGYLYNNSIYYAPVLTNVAMSEQDLYPQGVNSLFVDGENAITYGQGYNQLYADDGAAWSGSLPAAYPKGYAGFYVMKYETSQEQYVAFLNTLKKAEQEALLGAAYLASLAPGRYVFGDSLQSSYRNGIVLRAKPTGQPYIFDNDLNGNGVGGEDGDGQYVACNYMSVSDMIAYACWSGLRPMSELEYERACRMPYPQTPVAHEYAWNTAADVSKVTVLNAQGKETESANGTTNVNSGNSLGALAGPVRCGIFARSVSGQVLSGSTYWGVMEMSGNLRELVANVANTTLNRANSGNGLFNVSAWPATPSMYGVRGGGFAGADSLLRTSDRSEISGYITSVTLRDSTVGFRLTRSMDISTTDAGKVICPNGLSVDTTCVQSPMELQSVLPVQPEGKITYLWYVSVDNGTSWGVITGANRDRLIYSDFDNTTVAMRLYKFRRKAVWPAGEAIAEASVYVEPLPWVENLQTEVNPGTEISVSHRWGDGIVGEWTLSGAPAGVAVSSAGKISGIGPDLVTHFTVEVFPQHCPQTVYTKDIEVQRRFDYIGAETSIALSAGDYIMECWGARGGYGRINGKATPIPSNGGYCYGEIRLVNTTRFYVNVGGIGGNAASYCRWCGGGTGGWNGGGTGGYDDTDDAGGGGGGASDIRMASGNLYSRIMIAGGGGGGGCSAASGGGGGLSGSGYYPGTQLTGYAFGVGATGYGGGNNACGAGGCGGGYYGGFSPGWYGGSGGSGYISGHPGCNAIMGDGNLAPSGQPIHYSGIFFENTKMENSVGSGNGKILIRPLVR